MCLDLLAPGTEGGHRNRERQYRLLAKSQGRGTKPRLSVVGQLGTVCVGRIHAAVPLFGSLSGNRAIS